MCQNKVQDHLNIISKTIRKYDGGIHTLIMIIFDIFIQLKIICNIIVQLLINENNYNKIYKIQIDTILNDDELFKDSKDYIYENALYKDTKTYKIHKHKYIYKNPNTYINLDIEDINTLVKDETIPSNLELVDIGFGNKYQLETYENIRNDIPINKLVFVKNINQVVMKIGTKNNYKFINSNLCKVYSNKSTKYCNNARSIICNNNIKKYNKKCLNRDCLYFHDPILGYEDNFHSLRQFSTNPIVYNNILFKSGDMASENIKKTDWIDAINLYQSSLSNILIACMHSTAN